MSCHFEIERALCTAPHALDYAEFELARCVSLKQPMSVFDWREVGSC